MWVLKRENTSLFLWMISKVEQDPSFDPVGVMARTIGKYDSVRKNQNANNKQDVEMTKPPEYIKINGLSNF